MSTTEYPSILECVSRRTLANGLEIMVVHKPYHTHRYAFLAVGYGSMDLRFQHGGVWQDTPAGIAHYLEHKMFDTEYGNASQALSRNGAVDNAFTANAMTAYYFDCTEKFDENLRLLLDFVSTPYFTDESVLKERGIIAQEIRMTDDDPDWRVYQNLMECLYAHNPARVSVAGTVKSIEHITPKTLYDCHKTFYTPANMVLVCVGSMELEQVAAIAEEILPATRGEEIVRDYGTTESPYPVVREREMTMEIAMPSFLLGCKCDVPAQGDALLRANIIGDMACDILFGESSPLYNRLYNAGHINGSLGGSYDTLPDAAYLYVGGDAREPHRVAQEILTEAKHLAEDGIDETFYQQIRKATYGQMLRSLNSFENIAVSMAEGHFRGFDYYHFPTIFESITRADIEAFLRQNITAERAALSIIRPFDTGDTGKECI